MRKKETMTDQDQTRRWQAIAEQLGLEPNQPPAAPPPTVPAPVAEVIMEPPPAESAVQESPDMTPAVEVETSPVEATPVRGRRRRGPSVPDEPAKPEEEAPEAAAHE